jgi:hypothetical protein
MSDENTTYADPRLCQKKEAKSVLATMSPQSGTGSYLFKKFFS